MAKNYKKNDIKKAIKGSGGLISKIARKLDCEWHTANRWIDKLDLQRELENERESILDLAEDKLVTNIREGDNCSILFYLKCKGKQRGYVERNEIQHSGKVTNTVIQVSDEETKKHLEELGEL